MRVFVAFLVGLGLVSTGAHAAEFRTTQCAKHGHREIVFQLQNEAVPDVDRQWLIQTLEQMVAGGQRFKPGETMQVGWMVARFENGNGGTLRLQEPDMRSMPIAFVDSMDYTLRSTRSQKDTVQSFKEPVALTFPSLRQAMIVPPRFEASKSFVLERHPPEDNDSGWMMVDGTGTPTEAQLAEYKRVSLYEFALGQPQLVHLLAMPEGTVIEAAGDGQRAYFLNEKPLTLRAGSYLEQLDAAKKR